MDKEFYTVGETAKLLNVTKQCIYKKINLLNVDQHLTTMNNTKYITNAGIEILRKNIKLANSEPFNNVEQRLMTHYEQQILDLKDNIVKNSKEYEKIIQILQNQLETKDRHLENMQVLLKNEQDKNKLFLSSNEKKWWQFWK